MCFIVYDQYHQIPIKIQRAEDSNCWHRQELSLFPGDTIIQTVLKGSSLLMLNTTFPLGQVCVHSDSWMNSGALRACLPQHLKMLLAALLMYCKLEVALGSFSKGMNRKTSIQQKTTGQEESTVKPCKDTDNSTIYCMGQGNEYSCHSNMLIRKSSQKDERRQCKGQD